MPSFKPKRIASYFFQGLLYVVPVSVTLYVLYKAVDFFDSIFKGISALGWLTFIPGFGVFVILALVTLVGYVGKRLITPSLASSFDHVMSSTPVVKMIYTSVRDLLKAFVGEKRKFDRPVLVSLDSFGVNHRFGFITQDDLANVGLPGMVTVYAPCSYSFMGDLMVVPADKVQPLDVNSVDLMKLIVSGGVTETDNHQYPPQMSV